MTQIVVTLEEGTNPSLINSAIEMIKGVKKTLIRKTESHAAKNKIDKRQRAIEELAGSLSMNDIDLSDPRTQYILGK